jgi:branched-chain amino acid transport system ATP-binding protein
MMITGTLSCRNLSKSFGGVAALRDISLDFSTGQVLGVIGPNGSGKSTLFNVLSGELRPTGGEVRWAGSRIDGRPAYSTANMGIVRTYQSASVFPALTVIESMEFARWAGGNKDGLSLADVVSLTGLGDLLDQECGALPYGYQKLLGVALGLLTTPKILLLDEPAAGLNQAEVRRFLQLIRDIRAKTDIGIGMIDHDMSLMMPACDRIAVLNFGTLIALGTPSEVQCDDTVLAIYLTGDVRNDTSR